MAGEWLKFECSLPEKPETLAITVEMGWDDPDLTVGKLMRVFRWFDQHTIDGNAHGVTSALLDRLIGVTGFVHAMANAGWIVVKPNGLALHNFDHHNGATAKSRAQTAKRVANHRGNADGNADCNAQTVTSPLAREEKKREEKSKPKSKAVGATASRLPADWIPSLQEAQFCQQERPDLSIDTTANRFRDYWVAQPGVKGRKVDWSATWRNWVRNEKPQARAGPNGYESAKDRSRRETNEALTGKKHEQCDEHRTIDI